MKRIKVAVAGTGFGARVILPVLSSIPEVETVAICGGRDRSKTERIAQQFHIPVHDRTFTEICREQELDLVFIASPHQNHADMVGNALDTTAHIVCEKPLALQDDEVELLAARARAGRRLCLIDHQLRYHPAVRKIRETVQSGLLGRVYHVSVAYQTDRYVDPAVEKRKWWFQRATGGGMLLALGTHLIDLVRFCLGADPVMVRGCAAESVFTEGIRAEGEIIMPEMESTFSGMLDFDPGVRAVLQATAVAFRAKSRLTAVFHGERGELCFEAPNRLTFADADTIGHPPRELADPRAGGANAFEYAFQAFARDLIAVVATGDPAPVADASTFDDYAVAHRAVSAMRAAAAAGSPVEIAGVGFDNSKE